MRPLTEEETQLLFEKRSKYIGQNIQHMIDRSDAIYMYCFWLHKQFVYYVSEEVVRKATNAAGENLISLGTCFGKFTKQVAGAPAADYRARHI
jgi:60S ribosome subunit biogenesis protein NIP7